MIEDEAWPSAQAFTSWAKSVTVSPSILDRWLRSSRIAATPPSPWRRLRQPPDPRNVACKFDDAAVVDFVEHCRRQFVEMAGGIDVALGGPPPQTIWQTI